ncbi:rhodanese-like domain-containing protein [Desulfosarcina ovata]|uniref:Rhodanese domain-containing protein n=1 Tax=Desulfosarcina ovata subsp. ovata TaxID=2752305 RepID=A0A5K8AGF1_9BACT|nr:rhodanese-like domain-containing protein [Desulfosarcina ovata]BBO91772.1 hypothetical protein DSCOOX_49520 [Desulfosarcina ovata subsp. ovata]
MNRLFQKRFQRTAGVWAAMLLGTLLWMPSASAVAEKVPDDLIQRTEQVRDAGLVVSAKPLMKRIERKEKLLLIDVRRAADFRALHIAGAIHVPLHFIKTKPYLKSSPVVLVEQGLAYHRLAPVCRELRTIGVDARLLDGGMNAWCHAGGPIVGEAVRQMEYNRISAADFFQEKNYARRIVCDVSAIRLAASLELIPYAVHFPMNGDRTVMAQIRKVRSEVILVVSENGDGYADAGHALSRAGFEKIYYLSGGLMAYREYLEGLANSWQPRSNRMQRFSPCKTCGENDR